RRAVEDVRALRLQLGRALLADDACGARAQVLVLNGVSLRSYFRERVVDLRGLRVRGDGVLEGGLPVLGLQALVDGVAALPRRAGLRAPELGRVEALDLAEVHDVVAAVRRVDDADEPLPVGLVEGVRERPQVYLVVGRPVDGVEDV